MISRPCGPICSESRWEYKATAVQPCVSGLGVIFDTRPIPFLRKQVFASQGPRRITCDQRFALFEGERVSFTDSSESSSPFYHRFWSRKFAVEDRLV